MKRRKKMISVLVVALFAGVTSQAEVTASKDRVQQRLREMLEVPASEKGPISLNLREITLAAMARSDSFKAIVAKLVAVQSDELAQSAMTDAALSLQARQEWNRNQPNSLFGTSRFDQTNVDLGLEKRFQSGTRLSLGLGEYRNNSSFGTAFGTIDAKVAGAKLELTQSLWKDFFGSSTRDLMKSGKLKTEARIAAFESEVEDWFLQLSGLYHQVWFAQKRVEATRESLARKERLAKLFQRRKSLGISEEAEQIQVESAVDQARVQLDELIRYLDQYWNLLVVSLKLPEEDRFINPLDVPVTIDAAQTEVAMDCKMTPATNQMIRQVEQEMAALELIASATQDQLRPDLMLSLGLGTNGSVLNASDDFATRWSNSLSARYPAYTVGLMFRLPLDASAEKSKTMEVFSAKLQLQSRLSQLKDQLLSDYGTACFDLKMLSGHEKLYQKMESEMKRRTELEETRYRQARVLPFIVLQAGDELYGTTLARSANLVKWNEKKWALEKTSGKLYPTLDHWVVEKNSKSIRDTAKTEVQP
jgi:outer membrane protein TolC